MAMVCALYLYQQDLRMVVIGNESYSVAIGSIISVTDRKAAYSNDFTL